MLTLTAANVSVDAITTLLNGGSLDILSQDNTKLVTLKFKTLAFNKSVDGIAKSHPLEDGIVLVSGRAKKFKALSVSNQVVFEGSVGVTSMNPLVLVNPNLEKDDTVSIDEIKYVQPIGQS